jgi:formate dehydrogenase subunit delta
MQPDKLVMMANQIAAFFAAQGEERALPQIADHIEKFWDPRMRRTILAHMAQGGAGLVPLARAAIEKIKPVREVATPSGARG